MKKITLCLTLVVSFWLLVFSSLATADIPKIINYQGKLTDKEGLPLSGTYNVTFRLYDAATGGNLLWQEAHSGVSVQKGLFSVLLGSTTPLNLTFDKQYYLGIQVGADTEMAPRQQLASAPYAFSAESGVPAGSLIIWASTTAPNGWLICDGSAVLRTTYANLFAVIGTIYGAGDGATTFNLPNLKGAIPVGYDAAQIEFNALGKTGGEKTHTLTINEMPNHNHTATAYIADNGGGTNGIFGHGWYGGGWTATTDSTGGGTTHNILQPYVTLSYIVKY